MTIIDGKKVANEKAEKLTQEVAELKASGITPKLIILCIQPDKRSLAYMGAKTRRGEQVGIDTEVVELDTPSVEEVQSKIAELNNDEAVSGIILQLPIPENFDKQDVIDLIDPTKDVDGLTTTNQHLLASGKAQFVPATPLGVMELLKAYKIDPRGKTACVVGRSNLVGKPVKYLLEQAGAKVLEVNRETSDPPSVTKQADILVSAAGKPKLVTADMVKDGAAVIDVGITEENQKLHGDVDFEAVSQKASYLTPVPGGVGPMTVIMLLSNIVSAAKK